MERADIKLAIDMVVNAQDDSLFGGGAEYVINTLEDCGNEIAKQRKQIEALTAQVGVLREALKTLIDEHEECSDADDWMAMMCSCEAIHVAEEALASTPESALSEVRRAERELQLAGITLDDIKQALTKYSEMLVHVDCSPVYRKHLVEILDKAQAAIRAME